MKTNNVNYRLEGEGKTIIFIHGLSDNLNYWNVLTSGLKKDYQILQYDLRGHGKSDLGNGEITIDTYVDDLYDLISQLNIKKASIVGMSLGGHIALNFTITYPDIVENLILMSSSSQVDEQLYEKFMEFENAISKSYETFFDTIIKYVLPEDVIKRNYDKLQQLRHDSVSTPAILSGIKAGICHDITSQLYKIRCPVLILAGEDDEITSVELQKIMDDNLENSNMYVFKNTKHNILIGQNIRKVTELIKSQIQ